MSFDFWHRPEKLPDDFVQGSVVDDAVFSTITFRYDDNQSIMEWNGKCI